MLFLDIVMFGGIDPVHVPGIDTCNLHWGYRGATEWTCSKKSSPAVSEKYLIFPNTIQIQFKCYSDNIQTQKFIKPAFHVEDILVHGSLNQ